MRRGSSTTVRLSFLRVSARLKPRAFVSPRLPPRCRRFAGSVVLLVRALQGAPQQLNAIEKVSVRYTSLSKQDIEALQSTFQGITFL